MAYSFFTETKRQRYEAMRTELDLQFSPWRSLYMDIADNILPSSAQFYLSDTNRLDRRNLNILDDTGTAALEVCTAGMHMGMTNPARRWFNFTTPDPSLTAYGPVKEWLHTNAERMSSFFSRSNLYNALPINYESVIGFGTGAMIIEEDSKNLIHCTTFPIGSYRLANDARGRIAVFTREYRRTVRQLIEQFGERDEKSGKLDRRNFSRTVLDYYDRGRYDVYIDVCHIICPNPDYDPRKALSKYKKYSSCYYEKGTSSASTGNYMDGGDIYLREKGYDYFPVIAPRWKVRGEDVYANSCPGIRALGDIKQIQFGEMRALQAIDKMVTPPMSAPLSMKGQPLSHLPGSTSYHDDNVAPRGIRSLYDIKLDLSHLDNRQELGRRRIDRAFYKHLFEKFANETRSGTTAAEVNAARDEQFSQVGPVVSQINDDQNSPIIEISFQFMSMQGWVSKPPDELQGMPIKVDYISPMANAQKLLGIGSMDRFIGVVGNIGKVFPEALDKVDSDKYIEAYGDQLGIVPGIVRTDDQVAEIRQRRQQAQQAQAQSEAIQKTAGAAKDLSQADMSGDNALSRIAGGGGGA